MNEVTPVDERRNRFAEQTADQYIQLALKDLRYTVEHQGMAKIVLHRGVYQIQDLSAIQTVQVPPWVFGYKVEEINADMGLFRRTLYIKLPGSDMVAVPEETRTSVMKAVLDEIVDRYAQMPTIDQISSDCIRLTQLFYVMFQKEFQPGIVTPGKKG